MSLSRPVLAISLFPYIIKTMKSCADGWQVCRVQKADREICWCHSVSLTNYIACSCVLCQYVRCSLLSNWNLYIHTLVHKWVVWERSCIKYQLVHVLFGRYHHCNFHIQIKSCWRTKQFCTWRDLKIYRVLRWQSWAAIRWVLGAFLKLKSCNALPTFLGDGHTRRSMVLNASLTETSWSL